MILRTTSVTKIIVRKKFRKILHTKLDFLQKNLTFKKILSINFNLNKNL